MRKFSSEKPGLPVLAAGEGLRRLHHAAIGHINKPKHTGPKS